jgi:hypothetical protein
MVRLLGALALMLIATSAPGQAAQNPAAAFAPALAAAPAPGASDLSGSWVGLIVIPEKNKRTPSLLYAVLNQSGPTLTGTAGSSARSQTAFTNGRIESTKFGTTIAFNLPGPNSVMEFQLRPAEGMLRGVARLPGATATLAVELHRVDANVRAKASNVSGTWIGTFALANTQHLVHVVFEQTGAAITGTAGPHAYTQIPISNGRVGTTDAGTLVSFQMDMAADAVGMLFELKLTDTGLTGTITASHGGEQVSGPVDLKPVK